MFPVECVARGYLTGSGLLDYARTGEVCGIALPAGLQDGSRLPEPIFTPATKADLGDHDENVDYEAVVEAIGDDAAAELRMLTMEVYARAHGHRPRARHHPGRHQARVRPRDRTAPRSSPTRCSPPTPAASGPPTSGSPAAPSRRTTSRSCATGSPASPAGTARSGEAPPPLPDEVVDAHPRALRRGLRAADRGDVLTTRRFTATRRAAAPARSRPSPTSSTRAAVRSGSRACCRSTCPTGRGAPPRADAGPS